jgi:ketosteroid isomerase-like protein
MADVYEGSDFQGFSAMLRAALGDRLAPHATSFVEMMADDGVIEFPYAPPGLPRRLDGRAAVKAHLERLVGLIDITRMVGLVTHRTVDPDVVILEFGCEGRAVGNEKPYNQRYISVITLKNGLISHYTDYWNPLVVLDAMDPAQ